MKKIIPALLLLSLFTACDKTINIEDIISPEALHSRAVGASANELLSDKKFKRLKIEIQYMPGFAPNAAALEHVKSFLSAAVNKPDGISIVTKEVASSGSTTLGVQDIIDFEKKNRSVFSEGETIAVYILYTNGQYTNENTLGVAYRNTSAALFGKKIHDNSGTIGKVNRASLEATVLEHELAHLLGLVDVGTSMQTPHKDAEHGSHCNNKNCLMYYASETTDVLGFLMTGDIPGLDNACKADLKANGGK